MHNRKVLGLIYKSPKKFDLRKGIKKTAISCDFFYLLSTLDYFKPNALAVAAGSAFLLTKIEIVLYSTNGREK